MRGALIYTMYTAKLDGLGTEWQTGREIIDLEVVLGSGNNSSSTKVVLSDPQHTIGKALINHATSIGGIQEVAKAANSSSSAPPPVGTSTPNSVAGTPVATNGTNSAPSKPTLSSTVDFGNGAVSRGNGYSAEVLAALDAIALKEVVAGDALRREGYYNNNGVGANKGYFTDLDIQSGGGFPASAGRAFNVGRYQFNRGDWEDARKQNPAISGYSAADQDAVAYYKLFRLNRGGKELLVGDLDGFTRQAGKEWASIPGSPYGQVQAGYTKEQFLDYYKKRLEYHKTGKVEATPSTKEVVNPSAASGSSVPVGVDTTPVLKGSQLTVQLYGVFFDFVHQSTKMADTGITEVGGQGVRYAMSRRQRSKTEKGLTLKELATKITTANKVTLDWQASTNPTYEHIDQTGISDYALLVRECTAVGLMVTEADSKLIIKSRDQLSAPVLTLKRGLNVISYQIEDKAMSGQSSEMSAMLTQENKSTIDPLSSKVVVQKDKDTVPDKSVTGRATPTVAGTQSSPDGSGNQKARTQRIGGLPSTFTTPMSAQTVAIKPLDTVLTDGFGGCLDRIWLVDKITHKAGANTTVFSLLTPIDVINSAPATPVSTSVPEGVATGVAAGKWIYPCSGTTTSEYGMRRHPVKGDMRLHNGWDIAAAKGTPIYAVQAGKVTFVGDRGYGGGNQIDIDHGNGYKSIYLHNDKVIAGVGQTVVQGQPVALMGSTGVGTGVHLHIAIKYNGNYVDPKTIFPKFTGTGVQIIGREVAP